MSSIFLDPLEPRRLCSGNPGLLLTLGSSAQDAAHSVAADAAGNVYIAGTFEGEVRFDPDSNRAVESHGSNDAFVVKYDRRGRYQWARPIGNGHFDSARDIAVDTRGNVYIVGEFQGRIDFGDGRPGGVLRSSASRNGSFTQDAYILKLNTNGRFQWVNKIGGRGFDEIRAVAIHDTGIYAAGSFQHTVDFDPDPDRKSRRASEGRSDVFVIKLSKSGAFGYVRRMGDRQMDVAFGLAVDDDSAAAYVTGQSSAADGNAFIARIDRRGKTSWMRHVGGLDQSTAGRSIAIDHRNGDVVALGTFQGVADFDPSRNELYLSSNAFTDAFIMRLDSQGRFRWARQLGGNGVGQAAGITIDSRGVIHTAGTFTHALIADTTRQGQVELISAGDEDVYVATYSGSGTLRRVTAFGGTRQESVADLSLRADDSLLLAGFFKGRCDFAPRGDDEVSRRSSGDFDAFVAEYVP